MFRRTIFVCLVGFVLAISAEQGPPQTILVNNMELQAVRTDLSEKTVDFTAEYMYADGDVVNVTCINFLEPKALTMEYEMAGTMSDNSTMADLSSNTAIGFVATLRSGHNNSYMICTSKAPTDYTKVMVRFVMRTEFKNIASIKINGMTLRPVLKNPRNNYYEIKYKYISNQYIKVECEVQRKNARLVVLDDLIDFVGKESSYEREDTIPGKKAMMSYFLNTKDVKKLQCSSDDIDTGRSIEQVVITFTAGKFSIEQYPLHMDLPSNGKVLEVYNDDKKVIFYEFEDNQILELTCGPLRLPTGAGPVVYLQFNDSGITQYCKRDGCVLSENITLTEGKEITCCIKEQVEPENLSQDDIVHRQITVVFRKRVLTTTTSSTTPKMSSISEMQDTMVSEKPQSQDTQKSQEELALPSQNSEQENEKYDCVLCNYDSNKINNLKDFRNEYFGKLISSELQFVKPCMRTYVYVEILKLIQRNKYRHMAVEEMEIKI